MTAAAEPAGPDAITWTITYRVTHDGEPVTEFSATDHWYVFTPAQLDDELTQHGLRARPGDPDHGIQIITR